MLNSLSLLTVLLFGLIIISIILMIYLIAKQLKEDSNANLFSFIIIGIVLSLLLSVTLGIILDMK